MGELFSSVSLSSYRRSTGNRTKEGHLFERSRKMVYHCKSSVPTIYDRWIGNGCCRIDTRTCEGIDTEVENRPSDMRNSVVWANHMGKIWNFCGPFWQSNCLFRLGVGCVQGNYGNLYPHSGFIGLERKSWNDISIAFIHSSRRFRIVSVIMDPIDRRRILEIWRREMNWRVWLLEILF